MKQRKKKIKGGRDKYITWLEGHSYTTRYLIHISLKAFIENEMKINLIEIYFIMKMSVSSNFASLPVWIFWKRLQ